MVFLEADFPLEATSPTTSRDEVTAAFPFEVAACPPSLTLDATDLACEVAVDDTDLAPFWTSESIDFPADPTELDADLAESRAELPVDWRVLEMDLAPETPLSTVFETDFFTLLNMVGAVVTRWWVRRALNECARSFG
jgi:hypothetical protein